jgi:putative ABC transport system permease protein
MARNTKLSLIGMLHRSLVHRRARSLSALVAMTVSAGVATALLTLYADLDTKLHREFRNFGANIVITAPATAPLRPDALTRVREAAGPEAVAAEFAYAVATTDRGTPVVVAGADFPATQRLNAWWQADAWPEKSQVPEQPATSPQSGAPEQAATPQIRVPQVSPLRPGSLPATTLPPAPALIGQRAANFIADEKTVTLTFAGHPITLHGAGRLRTGGDEDSRIYIPLAAFTAWTAVAPSVIELQVPGGAATVEATINRLKQNLPELRIEPVRQLVEGESKIVDRTHALMYGAVLLIALTVAVSVLATLSASVLERRRDFALMKALGGSQTHLMSIFLLEALVLAISGVAVGFLAGSAAAWAISETNFHTATLPHLSVLPLVLLLNITIAAMAALFPLRVLRGLQPAALLKGE